MTTWEYPGTSWVYEPDPPDGANFAEWTYDSLVSALIRSGNPSVLARVVVLQSEGLSQELPAFYDDATAGQIVFFSSGALDPEFVVVDEGPLVNLVLFEDGNVRLGIQAFAGSPGDAGPDLIDDFESRGIIEITHGSQTLTLVGVEETTLPTDDPYDWLPSNSAEVAAFVTAVLAEDPPGAARLRFSLVTAAVPPDPAIVTAHVASGNAVVRAGGCGGAARTTSTAR